MLFEQVSNQKALKTTKINSVYAKFSLILSSKQRKTRLWGRTF